jgi:hypothetical protein
LFKEIVFFINFVILFFKRIRVLSKKLAFLAHLGI